jgi:hypothetical protein
MIEAARVGRGHLGSEKASEGSDIAAGIWMVQRSQPWKSWVSEFWAERTASAKPLRHKKHPEMRSARQTEALWRTWT